MENDRRRLTPVDSKRQIGNRSHFMPPPAAGMRRVLLVVCVPFAACCLPVMAPALASDERLSFLVVDAPARIEVPWREPFAKDWDRRQMDHALFDAVLKRMVGADGLVDYTALRKDPAQLDEYVYRLHQTNPNDLADDDERYAFWINVYNAFTLKVVHETLPADESQWARYSLGQVKDAQGVAAWKATKFRVGTEDQSLDRVENAILRPTWKDGRIHAAVNCASMSCPKLQRFAFNAKELQAQLDQAAQAWVNDPLRNRLRGTTLQVSRIFQWYARDFPDGPRAFLARFTTDPERKRKLEGDAKLEIEYLDYSWALNRQGSPFSVSLP